jgi:hypothetical protein
MSVFIWFVYLPWGTVGGLHPTSSSGRATFEAKYPSRSRASLPDRGLCSPLITKIDYPMLRCEQARTTDTRRPLNSPLLVNDRFHI